MHRSCPNDYSIFFDASPLTKVGARVSGVSRATASHASMNEKTVLIEDLEKTTMDEKTILSEDLEHTGAILLNLSVPIHGGRLMYNISFLTLCQPYFGNRLCTAPVGCLTYRRK